MSEALLPCPFCGREAENDLQQAYRSMQTGSIDHGAAVYCTGCNANMIMCRADHPELSDEERMAAMFEDWNRRATTPAPQSHVAVDAAARLERILRLGRSMKWTRHGAPALDDENTAIALGELFQIFFQNELDRALATAEGSTDGR